MEVEGSNPPHPTTIESTPKLRDFGFWLKTTRRLRDSTIEGKVKRIKRLSKRTNLWNIEEVKDAITLAPWSNKYKELIEFSYKDWAEFQGFEYKPRKYYREESLPYIPARAINPLEYFNDKLNRT